jgi:hypothetical protein
MDPAVAAAINFKPLSKGDHLAGDIELRQLNGVLIQDEHISTMQHMICQPPGPHQHSGYRFREPAGEGSVVYLYDSGAACNNPVSTLAKSQRLKPTLTTFKLHKSKFAPDPEFLFPDDAPNKQNFDSNPGPGHGTAMANIVAGAIAGISKRAQIIHVPAFHNQPPGYTASTNELELKFLHCIADNVRDSSLQGRAVLNMSMTYEIRYDPDDDTEEGSREWDEHVVAYRRLADLGVVIVCSVDIQPFNHDKNATDP